MLFAQLLFCSTYLYAADAVSVSGYLTVLGLDGYHKAISAMSSSNEFQVLVCRDGRWATKVRSLTEENDISYMTFDGADMHYVRYRNSVFGITNGRPGIIVTEPFTNHFNNACISAGGYPFVLFDEQARAQTIWLAFGAGSYLRDHPQKSMPLPWLFARASLLAYGFRIEYELSENAPFLVRSLKFIRSTALDLPDAKELDRPELDKGEESMQRAREGQLQKRKTLWPGGFVAGIFQVSGSTNYHGIELPLRFSLQVFNPQLKNDDKLFRKFEGIVTNLTEADSSHFSLPPILSTLSVIDERRRYDGPTKKKTDTQYNLKPGDEWYSRDAPLFTNLFAAGLQSPASDKARYVSKHTKMTITLAALLLSLVLPVTIIIMLRLKRKSSASEP